MPFADLGLSPELVQAVQAKGYDTPTPIQAQAIPQVLMMRDLIAIAQTGTGKTASFVLPMIDILAHGRRRAMMPRSLILEPTRELAAQVAENFEAYGVNHDLKMALLIGGVQLGDQVKALNEGVDVLIATPGRLMDLFERGKILLTGCDLLVIDEADRMLDMGFIPDIERIFSLTPFTRQTFFFSATMAPEIERITNTFLSGAVKIEVARQATTSTTIEQKLIQFTPSRKDKSFTEKRAILRALIRAEGEACTNAIVFCNRKMDVDVVAKSLKAHGFNAAPIHGDLDQSQRMKTLDAFRDGSLQLLIASDVAARGLDIPSVSHVFNFDLPSHPEDYVHRIGRTGRAGRLGKAFSIATPADAKYLGQIEALVKLEIPRGEVPEGALAEVADRPERHDRPRSAEGRGPRTRGPRGGDKRDRPVKPHDEVASMEPIAAEPVVVAAVEEAPAPARREERRDDRRDERRDGGRRDGRREDTRRDDSRRDDRGETPRREDRSEAPRRDDRRDERRDRYRDHDRGERVVGMGDHVPDFILRSFALKPSVETPDEAASEVAEVPDRTPAEDTAVE